MKKRFLLLISAVFIFVSSCNFLDIVPDDTPRLEDAFRNELTAEGFLFTCYSYIPRYNDARTNFSWIMGNETVASYHWGTQWFSFLKVQQGLYTASSPVLDIWQNCYKGIRQCHLFLDNVDKASPVSISQAELDQKKIVWRAEANFLLAYYHYVLLQNYGPVVIVDQLIPTDAQGEEFFRPRSPYDVCVKYIADKFDAASVDLPMVINARSDYGRANKVIAQALKAKMYLFAASPLYNGNTDYAAFKNNDGTQLISQTYDKEKWKKAMDENKRAIEMAEAAGNRLYVYNKTTVADPFKQAVLNTRWQMVDPWNTELIWGYSANKENTDAQYSFQTLVIPRGWKNNPPVGGVGATLDAVELFYTKNGLPMEKDSAYDFANHYKIDAGDETIKLHRNREPRFYAYIGFDRGDYEINNETRQLKLRPGETNGVTLSNGVPRNDIDHLYSGYAIKKGVHPSTNVTSNTFTVSAYPFPIIRLGELYLNYAEAVANYSGTLDADGSKYINAIRNRAGIPDLEVSNGGALSGTALVNAVKRERLIELMFEGHSLYDRKRWKTAVADYEVDRTGMRGLNAQGNTIQAFYTPRNLPGRPFIFDAKQYLAPINVEYIKINPNLVQNPGW